MLTDAGDLAFFDLKFAIQPLFQAWFRVDGLGLIRQLNAILQNLTWHLGTREMIQVYNQNGDGYVCLHEFIEAHGILQIALRMNPSEEEDPPVLRGDLHNLFVHVIGDSDPRIEDLRRSGLQKVHKVQFWLHKRLYCPLKRREMRGYTWIVRLNPFEMEHFGIFLGCRNHLDPKLLHSALYQVLVKTGISRPKDGDAVHRVSHPPPNGPNTQFLADHFGVPDFLGLSVTHLFPSAVFWVRTLSTSRKNVWPLRSLCNGSGWHWFIRYYLQIHWRGRQRFVAQ